jgi:hypothetical protein
MNRIEQYACLILVLGIIASSLTYAHPVFAQPTQTSYTVNLTYLTVQLSYPSEVMPGDSVTVNLQATTKSYVDSISLTTQVLYADNGSLHQLASATVSNNNNYYANSSSTLSKQIQFTVPQDAPRTSLVAALTEKIQSTSYSYYPAYYYPAYYDSSSPNCYYYPDYWSYDYGYCTYYGTAYGFPSYSYNATSDVGVAPLSYIKATTPEYVSLQSEYQMVQQQLAQSQTQNQQLQNTIAQRDATIANLNQQLSSNQTMIGTLELVAAGLAVVAIGVVIAYLGKGKGRTQAKVKGDTEAKT